jgi:LPS sulfotransferase NodH
VHCIPNAIDVTRFARPARAARRPVTIAMLSRLDAGKFSRRLLDYLPQLDVLGARLLIAGRGARRWELEPEIADRSLSDVIRFVGAIPGEHVARFLAGADIGLYLTDTAEETGSLATLEMLASGLPVVAQPKGCLPELVVPGVNGYLSLEPKQIAADLERLIVSPALRRRMGLAARRSARRWSMPRFRRQWRALVAGPRPAPTAAPPAPRRYAPWRPSLAVLVCGTPRAGSGLLSEALRNTGLVGQSDDFFEAGRVRTLAERWGEHTPDRYLERALEEGSTPNGVFGGRLSLGGLLTLRQMLAAAPRALPPTRYVWIVRRDRLRQAISWVRAEQSGTWAHLAGEPVLAVGRPRFDARAITRRLAEIESQEAAWRAWFDAAGATPVRVAYEDLAADYEGTACRVARALAIDLPRTVHLGKRAMVAMADTTTDRWVRRFVR